MEQNDFDTDLEDETTDSTDEHILPRISFDRKVAAHRSNRLNQTFGQLNIPFQSTSEHQANHETLVPLRCKTPYNTERIRIYENSCQLLDLTSDWQLRAVLLHDTVTIVNRAFCFNDIRAFSTAIEANLESLTLSSVGLTARSVGVLCQGLNKCIHLNLLDLSSNPIGNQGFQMLADTILSLPSLLYLSLADCGIQDSCGRRVADVCRHRKLAEINFSGNEFEDTACIFIGNALTENQNLTYLNLSWNFIRSYASIALFRGFEMNETLVDFDISWSGLGYDGCVALRRVLTVNKVLQRLNVNNCNIDWTCAKLVAEGLERNSTLRILDLASNPLTTHGVHRIIEALNHRRSAVSMLDLSGITVFSGTVQLARKIADRRNFNMKYDFEVPAHDILGRKLATKADSMRRIIEHIDSRNWRTLDYFRILENKKKIQLQNDSLPQHLLKPHVRFKDDTIEHLQQHLIDRLVEPLTYKNLSDVLLQQRMRDRLLKTRQEKQEKDLKKRNQRILETVNRHFPDIDIISRKEKHKEAIEQLSKPKLLAETKKL